MPNNRKPPKRRILSADIKYISLVTRGANQFKTIYKRENDTVEASFLICKNLTDMEKGELTAVVYAPDHTDSDEETADAEVIKEMAYNAAKNGFEIDIMHNERPVRKEDAYIAEYFIIQKGDSRFDDLKDYEGNSVDVTGGWGVVMKIENEELREKYRSGEWDGVSMGGRAVIEDIKSKNKKDDIEMDKAEFQELMKENNKTIIDSVTKVSEDTAKTVVETALKEAGIVKEKKNDTDKDKPKTKVPALKSDATAAEIRKHALQVQRASVIDATDFSDVDAAEKAAEEIEKIDEKIAQIDKDNKGKEKEADGTEPNEDPEIVKLEKQIADLRKRSNQPAGEGNPAPANSGPRIEGMDDIHKMSQEDIDAMNRGSKVGSIINKSRRIPTGATN